jgi:hypothetical protein
MWSVASEAQQAEASPRRPDPQRGSRSARVAPRPALSPSRVLLRKCNCADEPEAEPCQHCRGGTVQRAVAPSPRAGLPGGRAAPAFTDRVDAARGGGRPLPRATRERLDDALGPAVAGMRVHADARADALARAVAARAFTVGSDVFFAGGEYRPGSAAGDELIAHEAAHVAQQAGAAAAGPLTIMPADDAREREADAVARAMRDRRAAPPMTPSEVSVTRQAAEAEPEQFDPPPVRPRPQLRVIPGGGQRSERGSEIEQGMGEAADEWRPDLGDQSLDAAFQRANIRSYAERQRIQAERPIATMERGGQRPGFITEHGTRRYEWLGGPGGGGSVEARNRRYHVPDAIEDAISRAATGDDVDAIVRRFLPIVGAFDDAMAPPSRRYRIELSPLLIPIADEPIFLSSLDPGGRQRAQVLEAAIDRRAQQVPAVARNRIGPRTKRRGGCRLEPCEPLGDDPLSTIYCHAVTGSPYSYRITIESAAGLATRRWAEIDALRGNTWFECKCGYEALLTGAARGEGVARAKLDELDHQVLNHLDIARTCGLEYRYVVSNERVAEILRERWFGNVTIYVMPWEPCGP